MIEKIENELYNELNYFIFLCDKFEKQVFGKGLEATLDHMDFYHDYVISLERNLQLFYTGNLNRRFKT